VTTYLAFARAAFQQQFAYRVANWAGLSTNTFFLFFRAYVLGACTAAGPIGGYAQSEAISYAAVSQALLMVVPQWGVVGVASSVRTGQIAVDLLRPIDFYGLYLARRLGISAYYLTVRMGPLLLIGWLGGVLEAPAWWALPALALSVCLGAVIANSLLFLIEMSSFWLENETGVRYTVLGCASLLGGLVLPLAFFPPWVQDLSRLLPFEYTLYLPAQIWLGKHTGGDLLWALLAQCAWAVGMFGLCKLALWRGTLKLRVAGG